MWLLIGLGNPGQKYAYTRHNIGFGVLSLLEERWNIPANKNMFGALVGQGRLDDQTVVLALPQLYMNRSGQPVASLKGWFKVPIEKIVVVHDDLDIPFGDIRIKRGGGHGGHNGLRDLCAHIGTDFVRVRMGISRPPPNWDVADYVLSRWTEEESDKLEDLVKTGADAVSLIAKLGPAAAMNNFNRRQKRSSQSESSKNEVEPLNG